MLYYVLTLYISVGHVISMALPIITKYKCYSVSTGHVSYLISHQWKIHFSEFLVTSVNVKNTTAKMLQKPYNFCPSWHMWWFWCYWVNFISGKTNLSRSQEAQDCAVAGKSQIKSLCQISNL